MSKEDIYGGECGVACPPKVHVSLHTDTGMGRTKARRTGVTALAAPDLEQLEDEVARSRFSWTTSVKRQANSVLQQITQRKRSHARKPIPPNDKMSKSMEHVSSVIVVEHHRKQSNRSGSGSDREILSVHLTGLNRSTDLTLKDYGVNREISLNRVSIVEVNSRVEHDRGDEQGDGGGNDDGTSSGAICQRQRTDRYSCGHVKFTDKLEEYVEYDSTRSRRERPVPRFSLQSMWGRTSHDSRNRPPDAQTSYSDTPTPVGGTTTTSSDTNTPSQQLKYPGSIQSTSQDQTPTNNDPYRIAHWPFQTASDPPPLDTPYTMMTTLPKANFDSNMTSSETRALSSSNSTAPSKFRQFWTDSFTSGRVRTKSENQTSIAATTAGLRGRYNQPDLMGVPSGSYRSRDVLPLPTHAHTITGGSGQAAALLRRLAAYTNAPSPQSERGAAATEIGSKRRELIMSVGDNSSNMDSHTRSLAMGSTGLVGDKLPGKMGKPTRTLFGRFTSMSASSGKSTEDIMALPDPSKLPKEDPVSSLEFTRTRLKNPKKIPQKFQVKSGFDVMRRKRAGSLSGGGDRYSLVGPPSSTTSSANPQRPYFLDHFSKSEETLISVAGSSGRRATALILTPPQLPGTKVTSDANTRDVVDSSAEHRRLPPSTLRQHLTSSTGGKSALAQHSHHPHHHHHHNHHLSHRHGAHGHHRARGHHQHYLRAAHTVTRVTESRRYLMFTRSLPFWSTRQYMESHGKGLDSEAYTLLFQHTTCYDLIPESAKLVILDSQLTITKAFKALIYNGIRAAPVWNSQTQTLSCMLTVTDFVTMLNVCWSATPETSTSLGNNGVDVIVTAPQTTTNAKDTDAVNSTSPDDSDARQILDIGDFDRLTIQKWKEHSYPEHLYTRLPRYNASVHFSSTVDHVPIAKPVSTVTTASGANQGLLDLPPYISPLKPTSCPTTSNTSSPSRSHSTSSVSSCCPSVHSSSSHSRSSSIASEGSRSSTTSLPSDLLTLPDQLKAITNTPDNTLPSSLPSKPIVTSSPIEPFVQDERSQESTTPSTLQSSSHKKWHASRRHRSGPPATTNTGSVATVPVNKSRLVTVDPEDSLYKALRLLIRLRLHHLPMIDCPQQRTGNILSVVTQRQLLSFLFAKVPTLPQPRFLQSSLVDLNVGTFRRVAMVTLDTRLRDAMRMFGSDQVSALPVVDSLEKRRLINVFSKYDVITLVLSGAFNNPDLTIQEWLEVCKASNPPISEQRVKPPVEVCLASNNLFYVMEKLVKTGFRRLVIINNTTDYRVDGIVSLSDVLRFAIIQQFRLTKLVPTQPPATVAEVSEEREETATTEETTNSQEALDTTTTATTTTPRAQDRGPPARPHANRPQVVIDSRQNQSHRLGKSPDE